MQFTLFLRCTMTALVASALSASPAFAQYTSWYLAEGATTPFFEAEILVANPNASAVTLTLTFLPENGSSSQHQVSVAATSRKTLRVSDYVSNDSVSVIVDAPSNVLVERSMYWAGTSRRGGHHANGVTAPALTWYFAEGSVNIFEDFVLVANPSMTSPAEVTVTFLRDNNQAPITLTRTVAPLKRDTIWVNAFVPQLAGESFSTVVESSKRVPILAERAMYWSNFEGGHDATGVATPAQTIRFAEGYTGSGFHTFLLLGNPGDTDAHVTVTFYPESGTPIPHAVTIAAGKRETVWVNALPFDPHGAFSMVVHSDADIVAERAMYWGNFIDGHVTAGSDVEATVWGFAEGIEDGHGGGFEYDTFYLFVNATNQTAAIEAVFYREDGSGITRYFSIPARSRYTLIPAAYTELTFQKFSAFFRSTNAVPFVAERATYWGSGYYGGHASVGTPWTGAIAVPPSPAGISISAVAPNHGPSSGGTDVSVTGNNFRRGTRVLIGDEAAFVQVLTAQSLIATTRPRADARTVNVAVLNEGLDSAFLPDAFTYEAPALPPIDPNEIDLGQVDWLCTNVQSWAQTCHSTVTASELAMSSSARAPTERSIRLLRATTRPGNGPSNSK